MGYIRNPPLGADTYKRLIEAWADESREDAPSIMTFALPRRYLSDIISYCVANHYSTRTDTCSDYRYAKLTVYRPVTAGAS